MGGEHRPLTSPVKPDPQPAAYRGASDRAMKELLRSNDTVFLSWVRAYLADAGIGTMILDNHTSIIEGSIGAIPRRLMVADRDHARADALLKDAMA
jgi:Putative prokaryotic signal transducing protein